MLVSCTPSKPSEYVREKPGTATSSPPSPASARSDIPASPSSVTPSAAGSSTVSGSSCSFTADCPTGTECINQVCGTLTQFYATNCAQKCNFDTLDLSTSDGEKYTLTKGQGGYTAAGAVEWKIVSVPNYCPGKPTIVPLRIIKKSTGKILGENIVTVQQGKTSTAITYPGMPISFKITLNKLNEVCE